MKSFRERWAAPTPKFFRKVRTIGLVIGAVGTAILTAPVSLPLIATTIAGYLVTAGGVVSAISQMTIHHEEDEASKAASDGQ